MEPSKSAASSVPKFSLLMLRGVFEALTQRSKPFEFDAQNMVVGAANKGDIGIVDACQREDFVFVVRLDADGSPGHGLELACDGGRDSATQSRSPHSGEPVKRGSSVREIPGGLAQ